MKIIEPLEWPVGPIEVNDPGDVRTVQDLLDDAHQMCHVRRYGFFDRHTDRALRRFQTEVMAYPNGRVSPYGPTFWYLLEAADWGLDELTPIAGYMAGEMNANAHGIEARKMKRLNEDSAARCIEDFTKLPIWRQLLGVGITPEQCIDMQMSNHLAALLLWTAKVHQGGDWDHKPKIAKRFHPRVAGPQPEQHWHLYGLTLYFYEVWSNLHYGYVGRAAGFSESSLLDGAGLEQIGSDLGRGNLPRSRAGVPGLRSFDDPHDRTAIQIGVQLFKSTPSNVTAAQLVQEVVKAQSKILTKPMPIPP